MGYKITELVALGSTPAATDLMPFVDVSDTNQSSAGSTKSLTVQNLLDFVGHGDTGAQGDTGANGDTGVGATGVKGDTGVTGATGVGVAGDTGAQGETGVSDTVTITASPGSDVTATGIKITLVADEDLVFGNIGYIKSDGEVAKADADAIATSSAIVMALATIGTGASGSFLLIGVARNDAWNWTVGGLIYLSTTAGDMTQTAPTGTDDVVQIMGVATHADRMLFNPQLVQVELV